MSRTQNAIKNAFAGVISKVLNLIFAFADRIVFICVLGDTYLGVNGLYSEILMFLSVAELCFIKLVSTITVLSFVVMMLLVLIVPNSVFLILNCKSEEFAICRNRITTCVSKVRRRNMN